MNTSYLSRELVGKAWRRVQINEVQLDSQAWRDAVEGVLDGGQIHAHNQRLAGIIAGGELIHEWKIFRRWEHLEGSKKGNTSRVNPKFKIKIKMCG